MLKESACITRPHRLKRLAHRLYERLAATRPGPSLSHYSPQCVEGEFCELRHYGVLRSSTPGFGSGIMLMVERIGP
jgi:hypothetical protein